MKISQEREQLEKMISQSSEKIGNEPIENISELNSGPAFDANFDDIQKECEKRAKKLIRNATGLMLSDEMVKQNPYLKNKMQLDVISLSGMLYQLQVNETMQKTLMEEVRNGAMHPRMFEVFSGLSKTISEINKQLLQTVEAIKSTYRDLRNDINEKTNNDKILEESSITINNKGILTMGTKQLINETKRLKYNINNIEDVNEI